MTYEVKEKMNSFGEKHRMFQPNDIVRHFKGNLYKIITIFSGMLSSVPESPSGGMEEN